KKTLMAGIWPIPEQDYAMTESMGPIVDRTKEHLYPADGAIIRLRQMLIRAARNLEAGREAPGLDPSIPFEKIRSEEIIIGPEDDPWQVAAEAGEKTRRGERLLVVHVHGEVRGPGPKPKAPHPCLGPSHNWGSTS